MEYPRLSRFKRTIPVAPMQLTKRDLAIVRIVYQHRFLRSSQIIALIGQSSQQILRRLQLLYHHGFLERPRAQLDYYRQGGSRHIIYGLGNKGGVLLKQELGEAFGDLRWGAKNRSLRRLFLEHALLVSDVMVTLELRCRKGDSVRLVTRGELPFSENSPRPRESFKWSVKLDNQVKVGIIPDQVFAFDSTEQNAAHNPAFFFLEADRGTMPVIRKNLAQSSFYRKLLAYEATWTQGIHKSRFGFHRFRVLTVTKSVARLKSLVAACSQLKSGHRLFLFTDLGTFQKQEDILTMRWQTGREGETTSLVK